MTRLLLLGTALICLYVATLAVCAADALTLYVATNGNDAWSGRIAEPNPGGTDGPLATLTAARDKIRELGSAEGVTVLVRGGVYFMSEPFVLRPQDSGSEDAPVTYAAYPGESPVLSGGVVITGWREGADGVWSADVPGVKEDGWRFYQLFVNGERRTRARTPNEGYFYTAGKTGDGGATAFVYAPGDIRPWDNIAEVNAVVFHSWETSLLPIKSVDDDQHIVTFTGRATWPFENWGPRQRYYLENSPECLDAPGEWQLDAAAGAVRYIPLPGEDMTAAQVVAPRLKELIAFRGDAELGLPVSNVTLRGLSFQYQDWELEPEGHSDGQAAVSVPAAAMLDGANNCIIEDCEIAHTGGYGVWLRRGCTDCTVRRTKMRDLGAGGARIGEALPARDDAAESRRNVVDNNHIYDGGHVYAAGVGVWVAQASDNVISHNEIHDFNYSGMSIGWNWGDEPNRTKRNVIEYNHVHHVMNHMLNDGGAIYTLGTSPGSVIRNNLFHDVWPYSGIGWGIYLDGTTNQYLVENNIAYNTLSGSLMYHNGGHVNVIRNNVLAFSAEQMLWPAWTEDANTFQRNIIYFTQGDLFRYFAETRLQQRRKAGDSLADWDYNVYFNPNQPDMRFFRHPFPRWQAMGIDEHSVFADPQFVDADNYDFRLKPTSPALALGFKQIDTSTVGLYGDASWVREAQLVKHARTVLPEAPEQAQALDIGDGFEETALGSNPAGAVVSGEEKTAMIRVTDERAAEGKHSVKLVDAPGLSVEWQPHMFYRPNLISGTVRQSFDIYLQPNVNLYTEWRDATTYPACIGPSVTLEGDGSITASGKLLGIFPPNQWLHVEVTCALGEDAPKTYSVAVTPRGAETDRFDDIPFTGDEFWELQWLGFVCNADADATCYLDNLQVKPIDQ